MGGIKIKISTNSRYAIRFLSHLDFGGDKKTSSQIAFAEGISEKMMERIAAKLRHNGFVISTKGVGGGYSLAKPPSEITVSDILTLMETPYLPHHCTNNPCTCKHFESCEMVLLWEKIDNAIREVTNGVTIADIRRKCDD